MYEKRKIKEKNLALVGLLTVDEIIYLNCLPPRHGLATIESRRREPGGGVANTAIALHQLDSNLSLSLVSQIGEDERGKFILEYFKNCSSKISTDNVKMGGRTAHTLVLTDQVDMSRTFLFEKNSIQISKDNVPVLDDYDLVHFAYPSMLGQLDEWDGEETVLYRKLQRQKKNKTIFSMDLVGGLDRTSIAVSLSAMKAMDYCFMNDNEFKTITEVSLIGGPNNFEQGIKTLRKAGVHATIIVHSPQGAWVHDQNGQSFQKASPYISHDQIRGTVGAGDAFAGGYLYGVIQDFPPSLCIQIGQYAARGLLISELGKRGIPCYKEIISLIKEA